MKLVKGIVPRELANRDVEEAIDHYGEPTTANPYKLSEDERLDDPRHGQGGK